MDIQDAIVRMHHLILSWDYFEMFDEAMQKEGDKASEEKKEAGRTRELVNVPDSFDSVEHYISVFEPLLLEECSANIVRGCMEGEYAAVHETVVAAVENVNEWTFGRMVVKPGVNREFRTTNLVLLSADNPDRWDARREIHTLGLVEGKEGEKSVRVKFYLDLSAQAGKESGEKRVKTVKAALVPDSRWYICVLASLSTNIREWTALQSIRSLPFRDVLFSSKPRARTVSHHLEITPSMMKRINRMYNPSQVNAVQAGLDGTPVVLIQGPPGTGKTHAILGLLSVVIHAMKKGSLELIDDATEEEDEEEELNGSELWAKTAPWIAGQRMQRDIDTANICWDSDNDSDPNDDCYGLLDFDTPFIIGKHAPTRGSKVLVCAPSNSAMDEIIHRIISSGLMDKDGSFYHPTVVRVGMNVHHSVQSVYLDKLLEERLETTPGLSHFQKESIRNEIIEEADIVGSTLSYSGTHLFKKINCKFDIVVVDEAAQAVEPQLLIPLMNGARQVYMVGDPIQLPATVLSDRARKFQYNKSCFKRLMNSGYPVHMLNVQYRMNPAISAYPCKEFYKGKLQDDESVIEGTKSPWHEFPCLGPLAFYNVAGKEEQSEGSMSKYNMAEVNIIIALYRELTTRFPVLKEGNDVAVITPYKAQVKMVRQVFKETFGEDVAQRVDANSIDGFQGRQKDITFFSTVRSAEAKHVGFVADEHRINVGITRARCSLIIVGNGEVLASRDQRWKRLILSAKIQGCYYNAERPFPTYIRKAIEGDCDPEEATEEDHIALEKSWAGEQEGGPSEGVATPAARKEGGRGRGRGRGRRVKRGGKKRR